MPWHQDEGYWPNMPDKRALSFWISLDTATVDNGCVPVRLVGMPTAPSTEGK